MALRKANVLVVDDKRANLLGLEAVLGVDSDEVRRRAMLAGCDAFLRKPVDWTAVDRLLTV